MKKILLVASGGDAPGINDFLAQLLKNTDKEHEYYYAKYGFQGILNQNIYKLEVEEVNNLFDIYSSIIKCGRLPELADSEQVRKNISEIIKKNFDRIIILGGNGSQIAAKILSNDYGVKASFVPLSIDNDVSNTTSTLGYYTSLEIIINLVNNASYSINAHGNALIVEVMGRACDNLIDNAFNLSNAHLKIIDNQQDPEDFAKKAEEIHNIHGHVIVLIREKLSKYNIKDYSKALSKKNINVREIVLGHLQRGGKTSVYDKLLAYEMAKKVIESFDTEYSQYVVKQEGKVQLIKIA